MGAGCSSDAGGGGGGYGEQSGNPRNKSRSQGAASQGYRRQPPMQYPAAGVSMGRPGPHAEGSPICIRCPARAVPTRSLCRPCIEAGWRVCAYPDNTKEKPYHLLPHPATAYLQNIYNLKTLLEVKPGEKCNLMDATCGIRHYNAALEDPHLKQMLKGKTKRASEAVSRLRNPVLPKPTLAQLLDLLDGGTTMQNMQAPSMNPSRTQVIAQPPASVTSSSHHGHRKGSVAAKSTAYSQTQPFDQQPYSMKNDSGVALSSYGGSNGRKGSVASSAGTMHMGNRRFNGNSSQSSVTLVANSMKGANYNAKQLPAPPQARLR